VRVEESDEKHQRELDYVVDIQFSSLEQVNYIYFYLYLGFYRSKAVID